MEGMLKKGRMVKEYKDVRIKSVENGFAVCYDVEYMPPVMGPSTSMYEHRDHEMDYSHNIKEVFETKNEKKDSTLDRALARVKELVSFSY